MTSSPSVHPLDASLRTLFARLSALRFQLLQSETATSNFAGTIEDVKRRFDEGGGKLWTGSALIIRDLALWPNDPNSCAEIFPVARDTAVADECLELSEIIHHTARNWAIAQAYERYESYLKDILAATFLHNPSLADPSQFQAHKRKVQNFDNSNLAHWRQFIVRRYGGKNNSELFKILRKLSLPLATAEAKNRAGVNLAVWYAAWSALRHAITHSSSVILGDAFTSLGSDELAILRKMVTIREGSSKIEVLPESGEAERCIDLTAEYGYLIFRSLSQRLGCTDAIPEAGG